MNLTARAIRRSMNTKLQTRPVMSPWMTKKVRSLRKGIYDLIEACSHQGVGFNISPDGLMMAEMPVFAHLAIALRVSMALSEA